MYRPATFVAISIALSLLLTGCRGPRILRDGFALGESQWSKDEDELRTRAAFDLECGRDALTLQVLSEKYDGYAMAVGIAGCGNRMVYMRTYGSGWVANSGARGGKSAEQ